MVPRTIGNRSTIRAIKAFNGALDQEIRQPIVSALIFHRPNRRGSDHRRLRGPRSAFPHPGIRTLREEFPVLQYAIATARMQGPFKGNGAVGPCAFVEGRSAASLLRSPDNRPGHPVTGGEDLACPNTHRGLLSCIPELHAGGQRFDLDSIRSLRNFGVEAPEQARNKLTFHMSESVVLCSHSVLKRGHERRHSD